MDVGLVAWEDVGYKPHDFCFRPGIVLGKRSALRGTPERVCKTSATDTVPRSGTLGEPEDAVGLRSG